MKTAFTLIFMIIGVLLFGNHLSLELKQFFFSISLSLQAILECFLPIIVFSYLASSILSFKKGIFTFFFIILITVFTSNFIAALVGYGSCLLVFDKIDTIDSVMVSNVTESLIPLWTLTLPKPFSNSCALCLGFFAGLSLSLTHPFAQARNNALLLTIADKFNLLIHLLKTVSSLFLSRLFIPLLPLFILGFIINLQYSGNLFHIITSYGPICLFTVLIQSIYILILFTLVTKFNFIIWYTSIRNIIPAVIAGFSTMSSAAAMPLTLLAAEKNTQNPALARIIIPTTVNIHMIGNSLAIPIMAMSCLMAFGSTFPDFQTYILFGLSFALVQFAVAGVPSGGIFIILPLMEKYLNITPEMTSIILTLNILLDPPVTVTSIMGNSALTIFLNKIFTKLKISTN